MGWKMIEARPSENKYWFMGDQIVDDTIILNMKMAGNLKSHNSNFASNLCKKN